VCRITLQGVTRRVAGADAIHVLIVPNDSGKTDILKAIAALCRTVDHPISDSFTGPWDGEELVWRSTRNLSISMAASIELDEVAFEYDISFAFRSTIQRKFRCCNGPTEKEFISSLRRLARLSSF